MSSKRNKIEIKRARHPEILLRIAEEYGTPTYVYFESVIRERCRQMKSQLESLPSRLLYAMKANPHPEITRIIHKEGIHLETVSGGEVRIAGHLGVHDSFFTANNMTDEEMLEVGATSAMMNIGELSRLEKLGKAFPGKRVSVRMNPNVGAGHHEHVVTAGADAKFGSQLSDVPKILEIGEKYGLKIVGLHQHIGSGFLDMYRFKEAISNLLPLADRFPDLEFINVGGGLGIAYKPGEESIDFDDFQNVVVAGLKDFLHAIDRKIEIWFEPGRFLTAESGVLLLEANTTKVLGDRIFAGTNSGFNHLLRPAMYQAYHGIDNLSNPKGEPADYSVAGNVCESGDLFAKDRTIQEIREGDILAILDTGAYGMSMASHYNSRPLPSEILVRANGEIRVIRRRRSSKEYFDSYLDSLDV